MKLVIESENPKTLYAIATIAKILTVRDECLKRTWTEEDEPELLDGEDLIEALRAFYAGFLHEATRGCKGETTQEKLEEMVAISDAPDSIKETALRLLAKMYWKNQD